MAIKGKDGSRDGRQVSRPKQASKDKATSNHYRNNQHEAMSTNPTFPDDLHQKEQFSGSDDEKGQFTSATPDPGLGKSHKPGENTSRPLFQDYLFASLRWVLSLIGTILNILHFPIATAMSLVVLYWMLDYSTAALNPTDLLCRLPLSSYLEICAPATLNPPKPPPLFQEGLDYGQKLGEMQKIGADSVELPYYLRIGEGGVRSMIVQLSAVDIPSKQKLMPLLHEYRDLADSAIDGLQDWLSRIDQVVDKTILLNDWAEFELHRIEKRDSSPLTPINNLINQMVGFSPGGMSTQAEVREAFFGLTEKVQGQVTKALYEAQKQRGTLVELKAVLDSIALVALGDKEVLRKDKLTREAYWKWILRSYREQMADFDAKMEMCAAFYRHTEQAITVVSTTQLKMQQMRGELIVFRDGLQDVPLMLEGGKTVSLQLYIDMLKAGVKNLEATRKSTKLLKGDRMRKLEESMHGQ